MTAPQPVRGVVSFMSEKEWNDRKTGKTIILHSFKVDGDDTFYRTGTDKPPFSKGDSVEFLCNGQNVDTKSIEVKAGGAPQQPTRNSGSTGGGGTSRDSYWAEKERRDVERDERYQKVDIPRMTFSAARSDAVTLVSAMLQNDVLKLGNKGPEQRYDLIMGYVNKAADEFFLAGMHSHERLAALESEEASGPAFSEDTPDLDEE